MKILITIITSLLFFYINILGDEIKIINIAGYKIKNIEVFSNSVITDINYGDIDFKEDESNIPKQNLTESNSVFLYGLLNINTSDSRELILKTTYSNDIYPKLVKFTIIDLLTNEIIYLENDKDNHLNSVSFKFKGNRKYLIFTEYFELKNTINLESALFSLVLTSKDDNAVLGFITNTLLIDNPLKFSEHIENISEQEFDKEKELKIVGNLDFKNLLKEEVFFTIDLGKNIKFTSVEVFIDGELVEVYYNEIIKKYQTKNVILKGIKKVEVNIKNPEYIGDVNSSDLKLELNYNNQIYGVIKNKINYKKDQNILIEKISKNATATIGDLVKYEVIFKNTLNEKFESLVLIDSLPRGMSLLEDSIKTSNSFILEKISKNSGNQIYIKLKTRGTREAIEGEKITYLVRVNSNVKNGKNINTVSMSGKNLLGQTLKSNVATAEVEIEKDNFYDKGVIVGKVFIDLDDDNLFKEGIDLEVPGVKIFLENGDFATTDRYGKYSIYGVDALTHTAKVFKNTLPLGTKTKKISSVYSENGESRFVDLKKAQLDRSDFVLTLDGSRDLELIKKGIQKRFEKLAQDSYEMDRSIENKFLEQKKLGLKKELSVQGGILDNNKELDIESIRAEVLHENIQKDSLENSVESKSLKDQWNLIPDNELENALRNFNNDLEFINVKDKDLVPEYMSFQVKGPGEGTLKLFINNVEVSPGNITLTAKAAETNVFFLEYSSVKIEPGKSRLKLSYHDFFGVERAKKEIEIFVKGQYSGLDVKVVDNEDENLIKKIIVQGVDEYGNPIDQSLTVNIKANKGKFISRDGVSESEVTFVTNIEGYGELGYRPSPEKNKVEFNLSADGKEKEIVLEIDGGKSEFFLNGILEGRYNFSRSKDSNFFFEKEINSYNDKFFYRGAVYAEGDIDKVGYLTMTYDSTKDNGDKFFAYRDPEDYYPIFGDNSAKGYVGKSKDKLFLKIDRDKTYILYGDYNTSELLNTRLKLGRFNRTLTGGVLKYEDDNFLVHTFVANTSNVKYIEELSGEGVSGPYKLSRRDIIEGSETVTLLVVDKVNGIVLEERKLILGEDYILEYDLGRLYFSEPIPSFDLNFNPIKIKVSYEVEDENGEKSLVYGGEANYKIRENVTVGGSHFKDNAKMDSNEIYSLHGIYETEKLLLVAEKSFTKDELDEEGDALSISSKYETEKVKAEIEYERASLGYSNEDANVEAGVQRGTAELEYKLFENQKIKLKSLLEERIIEGGTKQTKVDTYLGYELKYLEKFTFETGGRQYIKEDSTELEKNYTIAGKLTWEGLEDKRLRLFLEYEQGIENPEEKRLAVGADYKIFDKTSLYIRHELISDLGEFYYLDMEEETNRTLMGIKTTYGETEIYSEYREENSQDSVLPEMGYGVKRKIEITENLEVFGTFERVSPLSEESESETSFTVGYDYKSEKVGRFRGEFEVEIEEEISFLNRLSYGKQLNDSTYFIGKNRYYTGDSETENRFLIGLAYRDAKDNSYSSLNKYELNYSKNIIDDNYTKLTHILRSSHNFQDSIDLEKTVTFALKNSDINYEGIKSNYTAYLVAGNISYDIYENWTAGASLAALFDSESNIDYGIGLEVGYVFQSNLWVSVGYNFVGFKDKDFDPTGELNQGAYVRFRMNIGDLFDKVK